MLAYQFIDFSCTYVAFVAKDFIQNIVEFYFCRNFIQMPWRNLTDSIAHHVNFNKSRTLNIDQLTKRSWLHVWTDAFRTEIWSKEEKSKWRKRQQSTNTRPLVSQLSRIQAMNKQTNSNLDRLSNTLTLAPHLKYSNKTNNSSFQYLLEYHITTSVSLT